MLRLIWQRRGRRCRGVDTRIAPWRVCAWSIGIGRWGSNEVAVLVPLVPVCLVSVILIGTWDFILVSHFFFLPVFFHFLAFIAKVARFRVLGFFDFLSLRSLETGIFFPFLVPVDFRSLPRLAFLMRIFRLRAMS